MSDRTFERAVSDWLESGSDRTPPPAINAVLLAVKTTPQERDLRIPRRFNLMPFPLRLAAMIALVAIAGVGAAIFVAGGDSPAPTTSPNQSPSAAPLPSAFVNDTNTWASYTSERYGFDIKRPLDWVETPADTYWVFTDADEFPAPGTEDFFHEGIGGGVRVSAWSYPVDPGTTLDSFIEAYCVESGGSSCTTIMDAASPATTLDGHEGVAIAGPLLDSQVFVLINDRVYIVAAWRGETDPSVTLFGGGRQLVTDFASTLALRPSGPVPDAPPPALTETFTSDLHGYSIDFPGGVWTASPATEIWDPGLDQENWADTFLPPSTFNGFRAASLHVPDGVTPDDTWIAENVIGTGGESECGPPRSTLGDVVIDGRIGKVRTSCNEVEATVVAGSRVYLFTLFLDAGEPYSIAGGRALFEAMIGSVALTPGTAAGPGATPS